MVSMSTVAWVILAVWLVIDCRYVGRIGAPNARQRDKLSNIVVGVAVLAGIAGGAWIRFFGPGDMGRYADVARLTGLALLCGGILFRIVAIAQLGGFHTPLVAIQEDHRLVQHGLYRHLRHPSYLGACLAFAGFGLTLANWLSAATVLGCCVAGYLYRIHVEETALRERFGDDYESYRKRTPRLIPWVF